MKQVMVAAAALLVAVAAQAQGWQDWQGAKLESTISVARTADPGLFQVTAVLQDAATGRVISRAKKPLLTKAGVNAVTELGIDGGPKGSFMYRLDVTVLADGNSAKFRSQFTRDGQVTGATSGLLQVQPEASPVAVSSVR